MRTLSRATQEQRHDSSPRTHPEVEVPGRLLWRILAIAGGDGGEGAVNVCGERHPRLPQHGEFLLCPAAPGVLAYQRQSNLDGALDPGVQGVARAHDLSRRASSVHNASAETGDVP